ncbi:MAG: Hint domain-containing protein [Pseudomonadota bacterium]
MVLRRFSVFDNEDLVVTDSPSGVLIGNPIINNSNTPIGTQFQYSIGEKRPITIDDQSGDPDILEDDQPGGHTVVDGNGFVADGNPVEAESFHFVREVAPNGDLVGPVIKITVFSQNGQFTNIWGMGFDIPLEDGKTYEKINGSNNGSSPYSDFAPCFGPGTRILTPNGPRAVENLSRGDKIWTRDSGYQKIRWIGRTTIAGTGSMAPIEIAAGTFGNEDTLVLSPQHRVLITSEQAEVLFGSSEVLVAAKHLVGLPGVTIAPRDEIEYTHIMFDNHEIVLSDGVMTESFFLSEQSVAGLGSEARGELLALFPSLPVEMESWQAPVLPALKAGEAAVLRAGLPN